MPREARKAGCKDLTKTEQAQITALRAANQSYHHTGSRDIEHSDQTNRTVIAPTSVRSDRNGHPPFGDDYRPLLPR